MCSVTISHHPQFVHKYSIYIYIYESFVSVRFICWKLYYSQPNRFIFFVESPMLEFGLWAVQSDKPNTKIKRADPFTHCVIERTDERTRARRSLGYNLKVHCINYVAEVINFHIYCGFIYSMEMFAQPSYTHDQQMKNRNFHSKLRITLELLFQI